MNFPEYMLFKVLNTTMKDSDEIDNRYTYSCDFL